MSYFGNWDMFRFRNEADDLGGFDPSGLMILKKERSSLEKGHEVGELVIPLARHFNGTSMDIESISDRKYQTSRADQSTQKEANTNFPTSHVASLDVENGRNIGSGQPSKIASTWTSMKSNFQIFKSNLESRQFIRIKQVEDTQGSSSESLDDIFQRLKRPSQDRDTL
ncbi:hypothetical protein R6Q57_008361 [Mikania cordata]